jgi:hypothetical protein
MSKAKKTDVPQKSSRPESQKDRWLKYGLNVALSVIVVIVLAVAVVYLVQKHNVRLDTTLGRSMSLQPQTANILAGIGQPVEIVGLYPRQKGEADAQNYRQAVSDLLDEYHSLNGKITAEMIDPADEPTRVDQLIDRVSKKYGGEIKLYKDFLVDFPKTLEQIKQFAEREEAIQQKLPLDKITDENLQQTMVLAMATVQGFPEILQRTQDLIDRELKQKIPDYKGATQTVRSNLDSLSRLVERVATDFAAVKGNEKAPKEIREYAAESQPRFEAIKKLADEQIKRIDGLGELKLDELRPKLKSGSILVMGPTDMRVLGFDEVWPLPQNSRMFNTDESPRRRFAGEQRISTALVSLTHPTKPKVVFVRPGGPPLTTSETPFDQGGPLSQIAERLREYNFQVMEKDLSGQWAMQSQMRGRPAEPEPTDEQIKDAVWVVLSYMPGMTQMGPNPLGAKVAEHLKQGGSALVLFTPQADNLEPVLKDWGINVHTNIIAVHEPIKNAAPGADPLEQALRVPFIFVLKQYGQHILTRPLQSLESLLVPLLVVQTNPVEGHTVTPILPVPTDIKSWGESDIQSVLQNATVEFNPPKAGEAGGDIPPPIFGGAVSEKPDGGRVVALGSLEFVTNQMLNIPDQDLLRKGIVVSRFPGNAELFQNCIFWLSKMDTMIAISPTAMEVSRIKPMSAGVLTAWRVGVLTVGLPGLVIIAGIVMYLKRRD